MLPHASWASFFPTSPLCNSAVVQTNTGRRPVSLCLHSKWQRRKAALVKIAATQDCGLDTMNPMGKEVVKVQASLTEAKSFKVARVT